MLDILAVLKTFIWYAVTSEQEYSLTFG